MVHALADAGFDEFVVPIGSLLVVAVIAAVAGVVAARLPARRANLSRNLTIERGLVRASDA